MPNPFDRFITSETKEHIALCNWLNIQYPNILWWHTPNEGKKSPFERYLVSRMGVRKGVSDFIIMEKRGNSIGLVIELKAEDVNVYKKRSGECQYPEQEKFLKEMEIRGFITKFCCGFFEAKDLITKYLSGKELPVKER